MRPCNWQSFPLTLLLLFCVGPPLEAQTGADAGYEVKRQKAAELFDQGKRLEALPLLEQLVQINANDDALLVALAASLIDHAATLSDESAAGKERLRARGLVDQALQLGNTSAMAMNLSQLLQQMPAGGLIKFSDNPRVQAFMQAGEAAFSRRDFDEALRNYSKALDLEPKNSSAALFTGNTYEKQNNFAKAAEWYQRAIQLDPNIETPYRYYADMLARQGDMDGARGLLIQAAVAEPYNRIVWRELHTWATVNNTRINSIYISIPATPEHGEAASAKLNVQDPAVPVSAGDAYWAVRTKWQQGGEFKERFPGEKEYRHTLAEESEALTVAAKALERRGAGKSKAELLVADPNLALLLKLYHAGLMDPYVLFSLGDAGIARDYAAYRASNRKKLEQYMEKFVVPPVHPQAAPKIDDPHNSADSQ
jgi:tetratricopeptide (TPR) repeat protein